MKLARVLVPALLLLSLAAANAAVRGGGRLEPHQAHAAATSWQGPAPAEVTSVLSQWESECGSIKAAAPKQKITLSSCDKETCVWRKAQRAICDCRGGQYNAKGGEPPPSPGDHHGGDCTGVTGGKSRTECAATSEGRAAADAMKLVHKCLLERPAKTDIEAHHHKGSAEQPQQAQSEQPASDKTER